MDKLYQKNKNHISQDDGRKFGFQVLDIIRRKFYYPSNTIYKLWRNNKKNRVLDSKNTFTVGVLYRLVTLTYHFKTYFIKQLYFIYMYPKYCYNNSVHYWVNAIFVIPQVFVEDNSRLSFITPSSNEINEFLMSPKSKFYACKLKLQ
jgi:hypothetical protein